MGRGKDFAEAYARWGRGSGAGHAWAEGGDFAEAYYTREVYVRT